MGFTVKQVQKNQKAFKISQSLASVVKLSHFLNILTGGKIELVKNRIYIYVYLQCSLFPDWKGLFFIKCFTTEL